MISYVDLRSARKRDGCISAKVLVGCNVNSLTIYACRQAKENEEFRSLILRFDEKTRKWEQATDIDDQSYLALKDAFLCLVTDSHNLWKRKLSDNKGEYFVMYKDSFMSEIEADSHSKIWQIKLGDAVVHVKVSGDAVKAKYEYTAREFAKSNEKLKPFSPNKDEIARLQKCKSVGEMLRNMRLDRESKARWAEMGMGGASSSHNMSPMTKAWAKDRQKQLAKQSDDRARLASLKNKG